MSKRLKRNLLFLFIFLVGAAFIYLAAAEQVEEGSRPGIWHELARDLGIALGVSATIGAVIEWTLSRDLAREGIKAAVAEFMDEDVWNELSEHIITQPVMRENFSIRVNVEKIDDSYVCTTTLVYDLKRTSHVRNWAISHYLDDYRTGKEGDKPLPRFTQVKRDGKVLVAEAKITEYTPKPFHLVVPVEFPLFGNTVNVSVSTKEIIRCPDTYVWSMTLTSRIVSFEVQHAADLEFEVFPLHPDPELLKGPEPLPSGGVGWRFDGVMLIGQSLEIHTKRASHAAAGVQPESGATLRR